MCMRGKLIRLDGSWVDYVGTFGGMVVAGERVGAKRLVGQIAPRSRSERPDASRLRAMRPDSAPDPDEAA